jgi:hypothetical protein
MIIDWLDTVTDITTNIVLIAVHVQKKRRLMTTVSVMMIRNII